MGSVQPPARPPTWDAVRKPLCTLLGEHLVSRWLDSVVACVEPGEHGAARLRLQAPNKFHREWIEHTHGVTIEALWRAHVPQGDVVFEVQTDDPIGPTPSVIPSISTSTQAVQLDFWEDGKRAAPNAMLRAALFPAINNKQPRRYLEAERLFSVQGVEVFFTGKQFDQSDLDVYLEILNLARPFPLGTPIQFSAHSLLKTLGRTTGNHDHQWLHAVLIRLRGGTVDITDHQKRYFGGLIEGGFKDEITRHYEITINPKFAALFGFGMWATIDRAQRQALKRNATAKALHAYYSSHAAPDAHHFDTLAGITGVSNKNKRQRRADLIKAHDLLQSQEIGFLASYEVSGDTLQVYIRHTPSQQRHLAKRVLKSKK